VASLVIYICTLSRSAILGDSLIPTTPQQAHNPEAGIAVVMKHAVETENSDMFRTRQVGASIGATAPVGRAHSTSLDRSPNVGTGSANHKICLQELTRARNGRSGTHRIGAVAFERTLSPDCEIQAALSYSSSSCNYPRVVNLHTGVEPVNLKRRIDVEKSE
jgi:hypothetical protein